MGRGKYITVTACATPTDSTSPKRTQVHPDNMAAKTVNRHKDLIKRTEQPGPHFHVGYTSQCVVNEGELVSKCFVHFNEPNYQR